MKLQFVYVQNHRREFRLLLNLSNFISLYADNYEYIVILVKYVFWPNFAFASKLVHLQGYKQSPSLSFTSQVPKDISGKIYEHNPYMLLMCDFSFIIHAVYTSHLK